MAKAVLTTKVDPSYDDLPEERYHFPRTYLNAVRSLHDWIVYYESRRVSGVDHGVRGLRILLMIDGRISHSVSEVARCAGGDRPKLDL